VSYTRQQLPEMFRNTVRRVYAARGYALRAPKPDSVPINKSASPQGHIQGKPVKNYYVNENDEVVIRVQPLQRQGESMEELKKRLVYQSRKRGILETDLLLSRFASKYLDKFDREMLVEYDKLLDELDWDIYYWATENYDITPLPDKWKDSKVLKILQEESKNTEKEILRMPKL
jgi:succinate dehydrogenase assembly factor 2